MDRNDIDSLLQYEECEWLEFKENNDNPEEIGEYISALSNSACLHDKENAFLVYGIQDKTKQIIGTSFLPQKETKGNMPLIAWLERQLLPRINFRIEELDYDGKTIVCFIIPATTQGPIRFNGKEQIRVGSSKQSLKDYPEKEKTLWDKRNAHSFENGIAKNNLNIEDIPNLLQYESYFNLTKQPIPTQLTSIIEKLIQEQLVVKEKKHFAITNLGAILFAKNLKDFPSLARKAARVILYKGKDRTHTLKEQVGQRGYATGFVGLNSFIDLLSLNIEENITSPLRDSSHTFPPIAIRELLANALIHQDFYVSGAGPMVEIFSNRIEISNPGTPIIDILRFIDHPPRSRNEKLATLMRRCCICEERGSGVDKVIKAIEDVHLPAPDFIAGDDFVKVILFAPTTLRGMEKADKIRACYQHCCLRFESGERMTNQSLRERFHIKEKNYPMISRIIADTIADGKIKLSDPTNKSRKHAKYIPFWG
ncbi:ATP-binding protein [Candidatus Proelusimicrobium volucris]|uniref:ATP-binding protein n=1 Tax=Candidatus Proelusimicrobium volucris TaxID=3416225 RepID=UPI003D0B1041